MNLLAVAALVVFIVTAVLGFLGDVGNDVLIGLMATGLAAWVAAGIGVGRG